MSSKGLARVPGRNSIQWPTDITNTINDGIIIICLTMNIKYIS
jgi:hypothetical protein